MAPRRSSGGRDSALMRSAEFIGWALGGLEHEIAVTKARLEALNAQATQLRARARATGATVAGALVDTAVRVKRSNISPEGRKRISEMMKKRWAERRRKAQGRA